MKKILLLLLLVPIVAKPTCILIRIVDGKIYIAADSRSSYIDDKGESKIRKTICKIHNIGKYYYSVGGHGDNILPKIIDRQLNRTSNYTESIKKLIDTIKAVYSQRMEYERVQQPASYHRFLFMETQTPLIEITFFYFKNGQPVIDLLDFLMMEDSKGKPEINPIQRFKLKRSELGDIDHIHQDLENETLFTNHPERTLENLVKKEISFHPKTMSEPIDVMVLSNMGPKYLTPNRKCETE